MINDKFNDFNNKIKILYNYDTLLNEYTDDINYKNIIHDFINSNFYKPSNKLKNNMIENIKNNFSNENNDNQYDKLLKELDEIINYNHNIDSYYKELKKYKNYIKTNKKSYTEYDFNNLIDRIDILLKLLYNSNYEYFKNNNNKEKRDGIFNVFLNEYNNFTKQYFYLLEKINNMNNNDNINDDIEMNTEINTEDYSMFEKKIDDDEYDMSKDKLSYRKNKLNKLLRDKRNIDKPIKEISENDYLKPNEKSDIDLLLSVHPNFKDNIINKVRFKDELKEINKEELNKFIDKNIIIALNNSKNENEIFDFVLYQLENEILKSNIKNYIYGYIVDLTKDYIDFVLNRNMPIENKLYLLTYLKKKEINIQKYIKRNITKYENKIKMVDDAIKFAESNDLKDEIFTNDNMNFYEDLRKTCKIMYNKFKNIRNEYKKEIEDILFGPNTMTKLTKNEKLNDIKNIFIKNV